MPQHFANDFDWHALSKEERCGRMPQIMWADTRQACSLQEGIKKLTPPVICIVWISNRIWKNQVSICPHLA
jgi:hypothetical protein